MDATHTNLTPRQRVERRIVKTIVRDALKAGYTIDVYDGETITLRRSKTSTAILAHLFTTDEDCLHLRNAADAKYVGMIYFVYGNDDGENVVCDHSVNPAITDVLARALELSERLESF